MSKTVYEIAAENGFIVVGAWAKPQKHGNERSYARFGSKTWPYLVITYNGMTATTSEQMGTLYHSLFSSKPKVFSENITPKNIPAERIAQAAKAFADAEKLMSDLKELNPQLPPWRDYEDLEWGDR